MQPEISIERESDSRFRVTVVEGATRTVHHVTVTPEHVARYAPGSAPDRLLRTAFEFLLEREPKEAVMASFDLPTIERYFPEFAVEIRRR